MRTAYEPPHVGNEEENERIGISMNLSSSYDQSPSDRGSSSTILIVDDEQLYRDKLILACEKLKDGDQLKFIEAANVRDALQILSSTPVDVILLDNNLPDPRQDSHQSGIDAIPDFLDLQPTLQIIVVTSNNDSQEIVKAMSNGAMGFLPKNIDNKIKLAQINHAITQSKIHMTHMLVSRGQQQPDKSGIAGRSRTMQFVKDQAKAFSQTNLPILLTGGSGVGKTHLAKYIHQERSRYLKDEKRRFVSVAINTFATSVVERELFGHEKGAFTGAAESKPGFFELANQGTLFLDEIGEASLELQAKLLKVLDGDGKFYRMGGTMELQSSFKLVCATNKDLKKCVAEGSFREDLFMRISIFPIHVPSLSERAEDIPEIIQELLPRVCKRNEVRQVSFEEIPKGFIEHLVKHPPDGNIRGIEHLLSRLLVQVISPRDKSSSATLRSWRSITGIESTGQKPALRSNVLTLDQLMNTPLDAVGEGFPGKKAVLDSIERRLYIDAKSKYPKGKDLARILDVAPSWICRRGKDLLSARATAPEKQKSVRTLNESHLTSKPEVIQ